MGRVNNKSLWGEASAINLETSADWKNKRYFEDVPPSGTFHLVYISDIRVDELQKDIKELKMKMDNIERKLDARDKDSILTMLASEIVLRKEWDSPEEDKAWKDL